MSIIHNSQKCGKNLKVYQRIVVEVQRSMTWPLKRRKSSTFLSMDELWVYCDEQYEPVSKQQMLGDSICGRHPELSRLPGPGRVRVAQAAQPFSFMRPESPGDVSMNAWGFMNVLTMAKKEQCVLCYILPWHVLKVLSASYDWAKHREVAASVQQGWLLGGGGSYSPARFPM